MIIGVAKETFPGEARVALVPAVLPSLQKAGVNVLLEAGAGAAAGFPDAAFIEKGAAVAGSRSDLFARADIIVQVRTLGANPAAGRADLALMRPGQAVIGFAEPLSALAPTEATASRGVRLFAMELMPRISRAQSMDALSSQAMVAGYKSVILAAAHLPRMFPMLMTAAGTVAPARVFVIGAGVAGLQAIATARRNGAVVTGYDIRPVVREQVESLGARFLAIELGAGPAAEDRGGYAKAMDDAVYRRQSEMMSAAVAGSDVVITTAAVPGRKSPVLVTADMVAAMGPGSVIVDLAAERGGNCELTRADETIIVRGVTILGPTNLASTVPQHASQLYAKNIATFLLTLIKDGRLNLNLGDEIIAQTLLTDDGQVVHARIREIFGQAGAAGTVAPPPVSPVPAVPAGAARAAGAAGAGGAGGAAGTRG
jgi:NAD(P) transhydrogenase subunit alpha